MVQVIGRWRRSSRCENGEGPAPLGERRSVTPANAKNLVPPPECETNDLNLIQKSRRPNQDCYSLINQWDARPMASATTDYIDIPAVRL